MATYLETKMTELADLVRLKTGAVGPLSVTSMVSTLLNIGGDRNYDGVKKFLERDNYDEEIEEWYVIRLPVQASSIGAYAFANYGDVYSLMAARGITYDAHAFDDCGIANEMDNYDPDGGLFAASYDLDPAPARVPNGTGAGGIVIPPSVKASLLDPTRYTAIHSHFAGLASTVRAIAQVNTPLTIQNMIDQVSALTDGGTEHVLARLIDRTVSQLDIPEGVRYVRSHALHGCTSLSEVHFPTTMHSYGLPDSGSQFVDCHPTLHLYMQGHMSCDTICDSNIAVTYIGHLPRYTTVSRYYQSVIMCDENHNYSVSTIQHVVESPMTVEYKVGTSIGITSLDFQGVDIIDEEAFNWNNTIQFADLTSVASYIDTLAFGFCTGLTSIVFPTDHTIHIGHATFQGLEITSLLLPSTVVPIKESAFWSGQMHYLSANVAAGNSLGISTFDDCKELTSVVLTGTITEIGPGVFYECVSLANVTIPDSVSVIWPYAFANCSSLRQLRFPTNLQRIESGAFEWCRELTSVDFSHTSLTYIGKAAFWGDDELSSMILPATFQSFGSGALGSTWNATGLIQGGRVSNMVTLVSDVYDDDGHYEVLFGWYQRHRAGDGTGEPADDNHPYAWSCCQVVNPNTIATFYTNYDTPGEVTGGNIFGHHDDQVKLPLSVVYAYGGAIYCLCPSTVIFDERGNFKFDGVYANRFDFRFPS